MLLHTVSISHRHAPFSTSFTRANQTHVSRRAPCTPRAGDLGDEQLKKALDFQLKKSSSNSVPQSPPAKKSGKKTSSKARKRAVPKPTNKSVEVLKEMSSNVPLLTPDNERAALTRQLSFNSSSDEGDMGVETAHAANGSSAVGPTETPQAQQEQQQQEKHTKGDKYAPCALYEDGTMMFTAEALQEVNYEDVLTS